MKINRLNSKRILLLVIMALAILMAAGTLTAFAADEPGTIYWAVDEQKNLTISDTEVQGAKSGSFPADQEYFFNLPWGQDIVTVKVEGHPKPLTLHDWFWYYQDLTEVDLDGLDTSECSDFSYFLKGCPKLTELDLSVLDLSSMKDAFFMLTDNSGLKKITLGDSYQNAIIEFPYDEDIHGCWKKTGTDQYFYGCANIPGPGVYVFDEEGPAGYEAYWALTADGEYEYALTISPEPVTGDFSGAYNTFANPWAWEDTCAKPQVSSVRFLKGANGAKVKYPDLCFYVYIYDGYDDDWYNLGLFNSYYSLKTVDLTGLDSSSCKTAENLFWGDQQLESVIFGDLDLSSLKNANGMFGHCYGIGSIDMSKVKTAQPISASMMFYLCQSLKEVRFNAENKPKFWDMALMFSSCSSLESVDTGDIDFSACTEMGSAFRICTMLKELDLSEADINALEDASAFIEYSNSIEKIVTGPGWKAAKCIAPAQFSVDMYRADDGSYTEYDKDAAIPEYQDSGAGCNIFVNEVQKNDPKTVADIAAAVEVMKKINKLGDITPGDKEAVDELQKALDALTDDQKAFVPAAVLKTLEAAHKAADKESEKDPGKDPDVTPDADGTAGQMGEDGTAFGKGASAEAVEAAILGLKNDNDPAGTVFGALQFKAARTTKNSIKLAWKKVKGAKRYVVYANKCGKKNKYKKLKALSKNSLTVKKVAGAKLKKGTNYKFLLAALDKNNCVVSVSKTVHAATLGGKIGNHKKVTTKAKKNKVTLKVKKTFKLGAKAVAASKKLKVPKHRAIKYETSNKKVATVSAKGVIKGVKKGKCNVYVYAQNGVCAKVTVIVK